MHQTQDTDNFKKYLQLCILAQMLQPVYRGGGKGGDGLEHVFNVISSRYFNYHVLFIVVYNIIFYIQNP